jgi:uncharacterized OB-fold protein
MAGLRTIAMKNRTLVHGSCASCAVQSHPSRASCRLSTSDGAHPMTESVFFKNHGKTLACLLGLFFKARL